VDLGGWFPDPDGAPGALRWWDGAAWTEHTTTAGSAGSLGPPVTSHRRSRPGGRPRTASPNRRRNMLLGLAIVGVVLLIGGSVAAGLALRGPTRDVLGGPGGLGLPQQSSAPPLSTRCQGTQPDLPGPPSHGGPPPTGSRIVDANAHISYAAQGPPFIPWTLGTWGGTGSLGEKFTTGQYFVTQAETPQGAPYLATVLSGTVPATIGDDPHPNIECAAQVIADDMRASYYPQPNQRTPVSARSLTVSGRPAYLLVFHLGFDEPGYTAKGELVSVCVVDVPGNKAAALYVSIPDTHKQYDGLATSLAASLRVQ